MGFFGRIRSLFADPAVGQEYSILRESQAKHETNNQPPPVERRRRPRIDARRGTRVLIIDDSATVIAVLEKHLGSVGYVTYEALDAERGLTLVNTHRPELIFLDIILPGIDGFATLRQIRRNPLTRDIPVIMMSGNEQATERFYASRIGADDFMKKPFRRRDIFAHIEPLLDSRFIPRRTRQPSMVANS